MQFVTLPVAREGIPFILACLAAIALTALWARSGGWGARSAAPVLFVALTLFVTCFFRDPERRIPEDPDVVVSPADGKVMSVGPVDGEDFMAGTATRVTIFLNIFNVHVQRAPLGGRVAHYAHHPGRYLPAWREEASSDNERASLGLETDAGPLLVRQIAGLVARRIVTYPREDDTVTRGDRIGLIRFGSRVDLFLPPGWPVTVEAGDIVRGGETAVARVPENARHPVPASPAPRSGGTP